MTGYYKKIAYLDYLENGVKVRNAGFLRLEENAGTLRLELQVKKAPEDISGTYELRADTGGLVTRVRLEHGAGACCAVWRPDAPLQEGMRRTEAGGVYIRLPGRRLIQAVWGAPLGLAVEDGREEGIEPAAAVLLPEEPVATAVSISPDESEQEPAAAVLPEEPEGPEEVSAAVSASSEKPAAVSASSTESKEGPAKVSTPSGALEEPGQESAAVMSEALEEPGRETAAVAVTSEAPESAGDKWARLCQKYPVIHPFGDGRGYLSVAPDDLAVLRQEFRKMAHNSFLLHGFYNYRHLILGRLPDGGGWRYYLGVPGNFYDREKMVAEMFGFEAFEGEKERARPGDFGYYMKKVEISSDVEDQNG